MRAWRILVVAGLAGFLAAQPAPAEAQAGFLARCAQILWNHVGRPLSAGALSRGGELIVDHFAGRLAAQETVTLTPQDVEALQQEGASRGMSECEVRQAIERAMLPPGMPSAPQGYSGGFDEGSIEPYAPPPAYLPYAAEAYCSVTGAVGYAEAGWPEEALRGAVYACINRGGIPECCSRGAVLLE